MTDTESGIDLYWLPLGAGGHSVRLNGRIFEAIAARRAGRPGRNLYHSALVVRVPDGRFVIEQTPDGDGDGANRGVLAVGAARLLAAGGLPAWEIMPSENGRAPGWQAGGVVARQHQPRTGS